MEKKIAPTFEIIYIDEDGTLIPAYIKGGKNKKVAKKIAKETSQRTGWKVKSVKKI